MRAIGRLDIAEKLKPSNRRFNIKEYEKVWQTLMNDDEFIQLFSTSHVNDDNQS
jgi:hypothetical protein